MKDKTLKYLEERDDRNWRKVVCGECGTSFRTHLSRIISSQRSGLSVLCSDCYRKGGEEIKQAMRNVAMRKGRVISESKKLHFKARMADKT